MARRRRDRWMLPAPVSLPREARGEPTIDVVPPRPVRAWIRTAETGDLMRVDAVALAATPDAVLVEVGFGQGATSAWIWRAAVKNRRLADSD